MKSFCHSIPRLAAGALAFTAFGLSPLSTSAQSQAGDHAPDRYIVRVKAGVDSEEVSRAHGLNPKHVFRSVVNGFAGVVPPGRLAALEGDARVEALIPDRIVEANPKPGTGGGGGGSSSQTVPAGVQRIGAAPSPNGFTGAGVGVAILDTGIDFQHPDLQPLGLNSFSAHGSSADDDNGHGTHVGGIVAARNNNIDVVGVAPDATLYAVKVLDASGQGSDSDVIAGLEWVADNAQSATPPIRVVNMSLGRPGTAGDNDLLQQAITALLGLEISVVVSAGNDCNSTVSQQVPASYAGVISVASTTAVAGSSSCNRVSPVQADTASFFTTDGPEVTISAPGAERENINRACFLSSVGILSTRNGGGTIRYSGTSMAAPHVAGVVALMWEKVLDANASGVLSDDAGKLIDGASRITQAPLNNPATCYTFDGTREGILSAPGALSKVP